MDNAVAEVRSFNRYYTNVIGALGEGHLDTPYTLTEARLLYELAQHDSVEVVALRRRLALDAGYLTRILTRFERDGLVTRARSTADGRRQIVSLSKLGRVCFGTLDRRASRDVSRLLGALSPGEQRQLTEAMRTVRRLLERPDERAGVVLRDLVPGDLGWIIQRHGELYASEYGWDATFEALVARIVAEFAAGHDPEWERTWIAEIGGERAGCVMCVRAERPGTAKLRLLLVEPSARGMGVGRRLVRECVDFGRAAGYQRLVLWTQSVLEPARHIYASTGFELISSGAHRSFGADLVEEIWELGLQPPSQ